MDPSETGVGALGETTDDLRSQLGVIGDDVRTLARQVRQLTTRGLHNLGDRAGELAENLGEHVRDRPMRSVLIAAGVGALVGLLLWRR